MHDSSIYYSQQPKYTAWQKKQAEKERLRKERWEYAEKMLKELDKMKEV